MAKKDLSDTEIFLIENSYDKKSLSNKDSGATLKERQLYKKNAFKRMTQKEKGITIPKPTKPQLFRYNIDYSVDCKEERANEGAYSDWSSHSEYYIIGASPIKHSDDFNVIAANEFNTDDDCYLLWVVWSTGDSFGRAEHGSHEMVFLFKDPDLAQIAAQKIALDYETNKYDYGDEYEYMNKVVFEIDPEINLDETTTQPDSNIIQDLIKTRKYFNTSSSDYKGYFESLDEINVVHLKFNNPEHNPKRILNISSPYSASDDQKFNLSKQSEGDRKALIEKMEILYETKHIALQSSKKQFKI